MRGGHKQASSNEATRANARLLAVEYLASTFGKLGGGVRAIAIGVREKHGAARVAAIPTAQPNAAKRGWSRHVDGPAAGIAGSIHRTRWPLAKWTSTCWSHSNAQRRVATPQDMSGTVYPSCWLVYLNAARATRLGRSSPTAFTRTPLRSNTHKQLAQGGNVFCHPSQFYFVFKICPVAK